MEFRENDNDSKEIEITKDNIKIPLYYKDEKYTINIYPSKDNINIIFKLQKNNIFTYYFFEKFDLRDFKQKSKLFIDIINIHDIFLELKDISKAYFINLENKDIKMNIIFKSNDINSNIAFKLPLKKKIVSQNKLNSLLVEKIIDNTLKLNNIKNQSIKIDSTLEIKKDIINNINTNIEKINNTLNNISIINFNNNTNTINSVSTKNSSTNESNSENNSNNNNEDEYQEAMNDSDINNKKEDKNVSNINKKEDNNNNSKNDDIKNENNSDSFFCLEKNDRSQNKKLIELLIIFNVIIIVVALYILSSVNVEGNYDMDSLSGDDYDDINNNRLAYLSFLNNLRNEKNKNYKDILQDDLQNKGDDGITSSTIKEEYIDKNKKKPTRYIYYTNNLY